MFVVVFESFVFSGVTWTDRSFNGADSKGSEMWFWTLDPEKQQVHVDMNKVTEPSTGTWWCCRILQEGLGLLTQSAGEVVF